MAPLLGVWHGEALEPGDACTAPHREEVGGGERDDSSPPSPSSPSYSSRDPPPSLDMRSGAPPPARREAWRGDVTRWVTRTGLGHEVGHEDGSRGGSRGRGWGPVAALVPGARLHALAFCLRW